MPGKIYFKGAGLVSAIGHSVAETLASIEQERYRPSTINIEQSTGPLTLPYFTINQPGLSAGVDRLYEIIDRVIQQALEEAKLTTEQLQCAGLFVGSTSFDMFKCEIDLKQSSCTNHDIASHTPPFNRLTHYIQKKYAINGPVFTFNTACTSSANALMYAAELIRRGDICHALVLGLEFYNEVTALGFSGLSLISSNGMRPFDQHRDGLYLGEACGALIISAEPEDPGFAYVSGANIGDNYSITASNPDGNTIQTVIERALSQAHIKKEAISIIKTHGTASLSNDEAEAAGLSRVFGTATPPIVTLKPFMGHTLGACGINELILFYSALRKKSLITFPSKIADEFSLRLANRADIPDKGYYLLNYFGFGGNSTALIIANA
ncbi:MAG: hypothetical protein GXP14_10300 [Gammaproteobacteria bacterium]|nr:hypothetical protein [Gammaproteobacteria bacterium]